MCITFFALLCLYIYEIQYSFVERPDTMRRWGWGFSKSICKIRSILRELERSRRCWKHVRIKNADGAVNVNSAHRWNERDTWAHMFITNTWNTKDNKVDSTNELTHRANRNCALASFEEEEQRRSLVEGRRVERYVLGQAREGGGGWTWRHQCRIQAPQYGVEWSGMLWWNLLNKQNAKELALGNE